MGNGNCWALHSIMETTVSALELTAIEGKKNPLCLILSGGCSINL